MPTVLVTMYMEYRDLGYRHVAAIDAMSAQTGLDPDTIARTLTKSGPEYAQARARHDRAAKDKRMAARAARQKAAA